MRLKIFFALVVFALTVGMSFQTLAGPYQPTTGEDEVLPWPWGTECPFPWGMIEGEWRVTGLDRETAPEAPDHFEFKVTYVAWDGTHHFEISRYSEDGRLLAFGRGVSPYSHKIIRAAMIEVSDDGTSGRKYWAIVRAYQTDQESSCGKELTTVITLRPINMQEQTEDIHFVIEKMEANDSRQQR